VASIAALAGSAAAQVFEPPVRLAAAGELIHVDTGHAAPFVHDLDGDGVRDLLVGQFGKGRLRVYRNRGTNQQPEYEASRWLLAGGSIASVPVG
jgi:hypothetical protein